jgi:hypothetical protein
VATAAYPGDIIPERRAKSSRNAERHQIGLAGDIIPDSRATSPGISNPAVQQALRNPYFDGLGLPRLYVPAPA